VKPCDFFGLDAPSSISFSKIKRFRDEFEGLFDVEYRVPLETEVPSRLPKGFATVHLDSLKNGMTLPLQPVLQYLLTALDLHPA